jgi:nucleoside-diphosphate-sugar epimerase
VENAIEGNPIYIEGDGEEKLDFTYIDDLLQGLFKIVINDKAKNETFNLTHGDHRSINDLVEVIVKHYPDLDVRYKERDNLRPFRGTLIVDKAKKLIEYNPEFSIEKGMPEYMKWYQSVMEKVSG